MPQRLTDPDDALLDFRDDPYHGLLDVEQFSQADALAVTGLSGGQLKGILDRQQITLRSQHNPGTGRRRMFCGDDIIRLAAAYEASRIGFPLRWVHTLAEQVITRMNWLRAADVAGSPCAGPLAYATFPQGDGEDWALVPVVDGKAAGPLPIGCIYFQVDRLLSEVQAKLKALIDDEPLPDYSVPEVKPEDPYSKEVNFFLAWDKDDQGRDIYTGLTFEESGAFARLRDANLSENLSREEYEPLRQLRNKHEAARLKRVGNNIVEGLTRKAAEGGKK